jgi:MFS family permease
LFSITVAIFAAVFPIFSDNVLLFTASTVSFLFMVRGVSNAFMRLPAGHLSDKIGGRTPVVISCVILAIAYYLFSEMQSLFAFMGIMALYGIAWGLRVAPETALISELTRSEDSGLVIALLQTMFPLGQVIGSISVGWLLLNFPLQSMFQLSSVIMILGALVSLTAKKK